MIPASELPPVKQFLDFVMTVRPRRVKLRRDLYVALCEFAAPRGVPDLVGRNVLINMGRRPTEAGRAYCNVESK